MTTDTSEGNAGQISQFGKYSLFARLGRGGMADVFLAVARGPMGFNKLTVIKRLLPSLAEEASFRDMFLDEARLAARLNHPNVVQTIEVGQQDGAYFIAMEYLDGQPLNLVVREASKQQKMLEPAFCVRLMCDALQGLHYAHELSDYDGTPLGVVHRDVSPHNIFITYDGQVKLVDFGIAKVINSSAQTEIGVLKGKVSYMAPEQARGEVLDRRADVFAAGIVLWELLAGKRLFSGESAAMLHRLLYLPIPRLKEVHPEIDARLDEIVARALEKERDARYQTASDLRNDLEAWLSEQRSLVRPDELGRRLNELFRETRETMRAQIKQYMGSLGTSDSSQVVNLDELKSRVPSSTSSLPVLRSDEDSWSGAERTPSSTSNPSIRSGSVKVVPVAASLPAPAPEPRPEPARRSGFLLLAAGLAAALVAGWFLRPAPAVSPSGASGHPAAPSGTTLPPVAPASETAWPPPPPPPPPPPRAPRGGAPCRLGGAPP
jgi:serine/threonine-protein kinase